jgi:acetyl esterase/lipase
MHLPGAHYWGQKPGSVDVFTYASAARAEKLGGLPPTLLSTAALDLFAEENMEYAQRLMTAWRRWVDL